MAWSVWTTCTCWTLVRAWYVHALDDVIAATMRWQTGASGPRVSGHSAAVAADALLVFGGMVLTLHGPASPDDLHVLRGGAQCSVLWTV